MTTKPDLYAHLGVPSTADRAAIRRAYRARARRDHPDAGGSPKSFALTKLAVDILSDEARRARYDATGDMAEQAPDNAHAQILEVVAALIGQTLQNCTQKNVSPTSFDFTAELHSLALKSIEQFRKERVGIEVMRTKLEKLLGRFTKKRKKANNPPAKDEPNIIEAILQGQLVSVAQALSQVDAKISRFTSAAEIIAEYDFRADPGTESIQQAMVRETLRMQGWNMR